MIRKFGSKWFAVVLVAVATAVVGGPASAQSTGFSPDPTVYSGAVTSTGTFVESIISTHGVQAILISVAVMGMFFVWRILRKAIH
jgi:hypothetical protein